MEGSPTWGDKLSTGYEDSSSLGEEVFQAASRAIVMWPTGDKRLHKGDCSSQQCCLYPILIYEVTVEENSLSFQENCFSKTKKI